MSELNRRAVLGAAGAAALGVIPADRVGADPTRRSAQDASDLRIVAVDLPARVTTSGSFEVSMTVENTGSEPVDAPPRYWFDDELVLTGGPERRLPISAGDTEQFTYGNITLAMLGQSLGGPVPAGEYQHSIGFEDGPRERRPVTVVREGNVSTTEVGGEPPADGAGDGPTPGADGGTERGFFTNGGDAVPLVNEVNLTVAGFALSVAGILHQLANGE